MLMHSGSLQSYEVAAKDAATKARSKIETLIRSGVEETLATLKRVEEEVPKDEIVRNHVLEFQHNGRLTMKAGSNEYSVHPHALNQLGQRFHLLRIARRRNVPVELILLHPPRPARCYQIRFQLRKLWRA